MKIRHEWLLKAMVESFLVVMSILAALWVDQWQEEKDNLELATQSLQIFDREIRQNLARVADVAPFHQGLLNVVAEAAMDPQRAIDTRSVMEGLQPVVLLSTAWETALATGALTHIDFEAVSALSLTYSIQQRFREETRSDRPELQGRDQELMQVLDYLSHLNRSEQELIGVYNQALQMIAEHMEGGAIRADSSVAAAGPGSPP